MTRGDALDWALFYGMQAMPMSACSKLGAVLSPLLGKQANLADHHNAKLAIARLRPDWATSEAALEAAADRLWANIGRTFAEFAVSHRMLRAGRVAIEGRDWLDGALASGRPIVAIFPHLGNWELSEMQIGLIAPHRGAVIVAPPGRDARAQIAQLVRSKVPAELFPISKTVWRQALAKLRSPGGGIMLAVDEQRAGGRVRWLEFGGTPDLDGNLGKAARLAAMTGAMILPFYNERIGGARFVTHVLPPIEVEGRPNNDRALIEAVSRMTDALRPPILRLLDQWYMVLFAA